MHNKDSITSIAIGGFDGMHTAHQALFSNLSTNGAILVIDAGYANLTPNQDREDYTSYPIFYFKLEKIKSLSGKNFIDLLKKEFPSLRKIVVGFDFHFGRNRSCSIKELKNLFEGEVIVLNEVSVNDIKIHTRYIREYIKNGDIKNANILLGKSYKIKGFQIKGQGLGSKEFVPTINLEISDYLLPNEGVYFTQTILNKKAYKSVSFLGHRVSTDGKYAIETHILNEKVNFTDSKIEIKFCKKFRDNAKFDSFDELKKQINLDIQEAIDYFSL
ncbi:MAG: bifunctional riboflavin kinase/FAD synthetase [Campylobacterales bacterium]|nr:bifunctional riboflavin kinase/FAD synthetase [Campylobacterales bacterium]